MMNISSFSEPNTEGISLVRTEWEREIDIYFNIPSELMTVKRLLSKAGNLYKICQSGFAVEQQS
jgi:hypothetical protein